MTTMTWLVRSCFSVCWLPLDDHELTSPPRVAVKSMAFNKSEEKNYSICNNNLSRPSNKCNSKKRINNPIIKDKDVGGVPIGNEFDHSSWSLSTDEDYIMLCFGKDVAQEGKGVNSEALVKGLNGMHQNSRPVIAHHKLKYGEDEEQVSDWNIHDKISNFSHHHNDQRDRDCVVHCHHPELSLHEEEGVMVHMGTQQQRDSITRACHVEGIGGSAESRNSDQSEGSRSSFAFPVLAWEWIGSPVQMPKSEGLHLRKHKSRAVTFQCCRF